MSSNFKNYIEEIKKAVCENDLDGLKGLLNDYSESMRITDHEEYDPTKDKSTALHLAIANKNMDALRLLLLKRFRVALKNEAGESCLELAAKLGEHDMVNLCLQSVGDVFGLKYPIESTVAPLDLDVSSSDGNDFLHAFKFLLENNADVNAKSGRLGNTPLENLILLARGSGRYDKQILMDLVKSLLERGSDPNLANNEGYTPLQLCFRFKYSDGQRLPSSLYAAVLRLLATPEMVKLLHEHGADIDALNGDNESPLFIAAYHDRYLEVAKCLLKLGADANGNEGKNPLFSAVAAENPFMIELLTSYGANVNCRDENGRGLLHYAIRSLKENRADTMDLYIALLLAEKGATIAEADFEELDDWQVKVLKSYQQEVASMKNMKVCANDDTTYYDLLIKRRNALVKCLGSDVRSAMDTQEYKLLFPNFGRKLASNYSKGLDRVSLLDETQKLLSDYLGVLPGKIITLITDYFDNQELKATSAFLKHV